MGLYLKMLDMECIICGVAEQSIAHGEVDTRGDGMVLVPFSWPLIWMMMDPFTGYMFSVEWQIVVRRVCILFGLVIIHLWRQLWQICM